MLKKYFHSRDQLIFDAFSGVEIKVANTSRFSNINLSMIPQSGEVEDFDFNLIVSNDEVGVSSDNLAFEGIGHYDGKEFGFKGLVTDFKMVWGKSLTYSHILETKAISFDEKPFQLDIDPSKIIIVNGTNLNQETLSELTSEVLDTLNTMKEDLLQGIRLEKFDRHYQFFKSKMLKNFPLDITSPPIYVMYFVQLAHNIRYDGKYLHLEFNLDKFDVLEPEQKLFMKNIAKKFDDKKDKNKNGDELFGQFYIDENAF